MSKQNKFKVSLIGRGFNRCFNRGFFATSALIAAISVSPAALAQNSPVIVDLSVLDDNGNARTTGALPALNDGGVFSKLLMPGQRPPKSTYYGPTVSIQGIGNIVDTAPVIPSASLTAADSVSAPDTVSEPTPEAPAVASAAPQAVVTETQSMPEVIDLAPAIESAPPALPESVATTAQDEPAAAPEPEPKTETASLPPETVQSSVSAEPGRAMQVIYEQANSEIPSGNENGLKAVVEIINANENFRIQLMAFAGGADLSSSKARRLSLSRALSVRSYFIGQGIRSTRIDVRALGDKTDETPLNRVDINITER